MLLRPLRWVSKVVFYEGLEVRIIDRLVNLVGAFARGAGAVLQLFQSGNIQRYLSIFVMALAILLYGWLTP